MLNSMRKLLLILLGVAVCFNALAWSGDGHRFVAQIAYDNLTPQAKRQVDSLTFPEGEKFRGNSRFIYISTWADRIRFQGDHRFDKWHYISLPISVQHAPTKQLDHKNAVYAIEQAEKVLSNKYAANKKKLLYLKLLVHCVGDVHQPLHSVSRYTWKTPNGDYGGNSYMIFNPYHRRVSLHHFWDSGLGLFKNYNRQYPVHPVKVKKVAQLLERKFQYCLDDPLVMDVPPMAWAREGQAIARNFVYDTPKKLAPDRAYINRGQEIVRKRLALAGFRLANILNHVFKG